MTERADSERNPSASPLAYDLFCGFGGWARGLLDAGYRVVGFDNDPKCAKHYPGEFRLQDLTKLDGSTLRDGDLIVASPPCQFYSKLVLPRQWHETWKADDGGKLFYEALRIIQEANPKWWVIENVRGAAKVHGPPVKRVGSRYLWGRFPIMDPVPVYDKYRRSPSPDRANLRSLIPYPLARAVAEACL